MQGEGDRHAHVRIAEVGERGAIAQVHEAVHDGLRMDDHVQPVIREPEQVVGLDQLQPLVHQRGRVDRDLASHVPGGVGERLLHADRLQLVADQPPERPARGGEDQAVDGSGQSHEEPRDRETDREQEDCEREPPEVFPCERRDKHSALDPNARS